MRILIIGGSGFIGQDVVSCLKRMGHDIILFNRGYPQFETVGGIESIIGDLRNFEHHGPQIRDLAPQVVLADMFHFSDIDARRVIRTLKGISKRIVAISGTDVYRIYGRLFNLEPGVPEPVPVTEASFLREKEFPGMGGYDKLNMERAIMGDPDMPGTLIRLPPVYGPRSVMHRIYFYLKRMDDRRPYILLSRYLAAWQWTHGYVENMAYAVALACIDERATGRIYNVGDPGPVSMAQWLKKIGKVAGWDGDIVIASHNRLVEISPYAMVPINAAQDAIVDSALIRNELGYSEIVDPDTAVNRTVEWERTHPIASQLMGPMFFDYEEEDRIVRDINASGPGAKDLSLQ